MIVVSKNNPLKEWKRKVFLAEQTLSYYFIKYHDRQLDIDLKYVYFWYH